MISNLFNKSEMGAVFDLLSHQHKLLLEIQLINPKNHKTEGRGFFNDVDFLCEAASVHLGRFNFALTPYAYSPDHIPSRSSYNQFDRAMVEANPESWSRPHSLTVIFAFQPEALREIENNLDPQQGIVQMAYQIGAIMERLHIQSFSLEYNPLSITARFVPHFFQIEPSLTKPNFLHLTKLFRDCLEKEMTKAEHKKFALGSTILGQGMDPMPGLPGNFGDTNDVSTVWSLSLPCLSDDPIFEALFEESQTGKKTKSSTVYAASNLQGLSQSWSDEPDEIPHKDLKAPAKPTKVESETEADGYSERKQKEEIGLLESQLKLALSTAWNWPLMSQTFNHLYGGTQGGQVLLMQADPFAGELAFQFFLQCTEPMTREGKGQLLIFSKKRKQADLALAALSRHYGFNPLLAQDGAKTDPMLMAKNYASLFATPPLMPVCGANEGLENLINYLEHDFQLRQKRRSGAPIPLVILIDNLEEFRSEGAETYRGLMRLRQRLNDLNATLWLTHLTSPSQAESVRPFLGLCDYHALLDHDGNFETPRVGMAAWEQAFSPDPSLRPTLHEIGLVRISFSAQGSHRRYPSSYLYHRPTFLFKEMTPEQKK